MTYRTDHHSHHRSGRSASAHIHGSEHGSSFGSGGHGRSRHSGGRMFGHGGLRLVLLTLLAEQPRHGYELIKEVSERLNGAYTPSPGVVYPTLNWMQEAGFATVEDAEESRKLYTITALGRAYLEAHKDAAEALMARMTQAAAEGARSPQLLRAMENLKTALRLADNRGDGEGVGHRMRSTFLADLLDETAKKVERIR